MCRRKIRTDTTHLATHILLNTKHGAIQILWACHKKTQVREPGKLKGKKSETKKNKSEHTDQLAQTKKHNRLTD